MKKGENYELLVQKLEKALDNKAEVKHNQRLKSPEGRIQIDVTTETKIKGQNKLSVIEVKDRKRPLDRVIIDPIPSILEDVRADRASVYSNSGFSKSALQKSKRKKIGVFSVIKSGDKNVKTQITKEIVAMRITLELVDIDAKWKLADHSFVQTKSPIILEWALGKVRKNIDTFINRPNKRNRVFKMEFKSVQPIIFNDLNLPYPVVGLIIQSRPMIEWVKQVVSVSATFGQYDHLGKAITIPNREALSLGIIDNSKWETTKIKEGSNKISNKNYIEIEIKIFKTDIRFDRCENIEIDKLFIEEKPTK